MTAGTLPQWGLPPAEWNQTERAYPDTLLHEAFEAQAARTPTAPAVRFGDVTLTYAELHERVGVLATHLVRIGAEPGSLVAVCMDRSVEMVVALYAILMAGGAYVPVDPSTRLSASPSCSRTCEGRSCSRRATWRSASRSRRRDVITIEPCDPAAGRAGAPCTPGSRPSDLAYVIYTSGSTGQPKGAMNTHGAIANRSAGCRNATG